MKNGENMSPIHYANNAEMIEMLLKNGADPNLRSLTTNMTVFDTFLDTMPEGCLAILNHYISLDGSSVQGHDLKITFDYKLIHSYNSREMEFLHNIVTENRIDLLKHPICESFLHLKWLRVRKYFYAYVGFYLIFLLVLNVMILFDLSPIFQESRAGIEPYTMGLNYALIVLLIFLILKNVILIIYSIKIYFKNWQNFLELLLIIITILYLTFYFINSEIRAHFGALALFGVWGNFTLIMGKIPAAGIYIIMITGVTKGLLKFLLLYTTFLVGFSMCFHILSGSVGSVYFDNPLTSFMTTLTMMVGELNYVDVAVDVSKYIHSTFRAFL